MKILHIIKNGRSDLAKHIIDIQSADNEVKVIKLSKKDISYDEVIDDIFSFDKVISW